MNAHRIALSLAMASCSCAFSAAAAEAAATAGDQPTRVRVAAISFVPEKLNIRGNADRLEQAFREAAAGGAR